jgi:hypothetical protein
MGDFCHVKVPVPQAAEADTLLASLRRTRPWRPSLLWCCELRGGLGGLLSRQRPITGRLVPTVIQNSCYFLDHNTNHNFMRTSISIHVHLQLTESTLKIAQLVKKFPVFYGAPKFMIIFTRTCHWSLS